MSLTDRIAKDHHATAMVALDSFELIAERVGRLLSHGRRLSMSRRYTYVNEPPELFVGLTVGAFVSRRNHEGCWFDVPLEPGLERFGFAAYAADGNASEDQAWKRYHAAKAESPDFFERRRDMTEIELTGGREQDEASRDDRIVIRSWNRDGVCDERVIAFEAGGR